MHQLAAVTAMFLALSAQGVARATTGTLMVTISLQGNAGLCTS